MKNFMNKTSSTKFNFPVFFMAMLGVVFLVIFNYLPMFGIIIAFKDMDGVINITKALVTKPFVGFQNFIDFLNDKYFRDVMINTIGLNVFQLVLSFPAPIIFALLLNEVRHLGFKKTVQTITYFPYFVSWVVFGGIVISMLSSDNGIINVVLQKLGLIKEPISFLANPNYFWSIATVSGIIKGLGWGAVIYLAAIAGIDVEQYEAAIIDGANRFQRMLYITLPGILSTIVILLLLSISNLLNSSFDQIYVLQNQLNLDRSEVIDTYVYKIGISEMRYSFTTAVGVFKSFIAFLLLWGSNTLSKKYLNRGIY
ncbi:MAG TPA: sugar ABC transporter permease [Clostridiaceae bacterium]|nr:sugar ABC transporter permease [Clostridiaceae bacterium]